MTSHEAPLAQGNDVGSRGSGAWWGCGLISSDITKVTFDLPTETYTFDTAQWNIPPTCRGVTFPAASPARAVSDCCTAGGAAGIDCATTTLDLSRRAPAPPSSPNRRPRRSTWRPTSCRSLSQYTSLSASRSAASATRSGATASTSTCRRYSIYLAPDGVTDPTDPRAAAVRHRPRHPGGDHPERERAAGAQRRRASSRRSPGTSSTPFRSSPRRTVVVAARYAGSDRRDHHRGDRRRLRAAVTPARVISASTATSSSPAPGRPASRRRWRWRRADSRRADPLPRQGALPARQALRRRAHRPRARGAGGLGLEVRVPHVAVRARARIVYGGRARDVALGRPVDIVRRRELRRRSGRAGARARDRDRRRGRGWRRSTSTRRRPWCAVDAPRRAAA